KLWVSTQQVCTFYIYTILKGSVTMENTYHHSHLNDTYFDYTLSIINGKWKLTIIYYLSTYEVVRFNQLKRYLGKITYKTLSDSLKELEQDGLVNRKAFPQIPPKVEYSLTEKGKSLWPIIENMCSWGEQNKY